MKIDDICPWTETMLRHPKGDPTSVPGRTPCIGHQKDTQLMLPKGDPALVPSRRLYIGSWAESRPASPDGHSAEAVVS